ncbi:6-phosphogluconolactonase [Verrucomicrobiota bacterium]
MKYREFNAYSELRDNALALLKEHVVKKSFEPHAVMLSGAKTPQPIYDAIASNPPDVHRSFHLILADDRYVPVESKDSNYGNMLGMIKTLGLSESQVLRIHAELDLDAAAEKYDNNLASFLNNGGSIPLGFLGLGTDGHTASLFSKDLLKETGRYAIAVSRPDGMEGISVTREFLLKCDSLIFLVTGPEKQQAVERMMNNPQDVVAAQAVSGVKHVELWYSAQRAEGGNPETSTGCKHLRPE